MEGVKYNPEFIDCSITEKGIGQCEKAKEQMKNFQPDVIVVSPLERTLETCSLIFKDRDIPVFVEPVLAEAYRSSCDISKDLAGKK